jgi:hypothetical protein
MELYSGWVRIDEVSGHRCSSKLNLLHIFEQVFIDVDRGTVDLRLRTSCVAFNPN